MNTLSTKQPTPQHISCNPFERNEFLSGRQIYYTFYNRFPSMLGISGLRPEAVYGWLEQRATESARGILRYETRDAASGKMNLESMIYIEYDREIIIQIDETEGRIIYDSQCESYARELLGIIAQFVQKPRRSAACIYVVVDGGGGIELQRVPCPPRKVLLKTHYNDDMLRLHPQILRTLRMKGRSGLYLLHGVPGAGKSSYIRSLLPQLNKRCIFLSPRLAGNLDSPGLSGILLRNPESILIVEDAEELLISRDQHSSSGISSLLNITDGVLGASLGIQMICTFNTRLTSIDPALLRKGRLIARYEFGALALDKTQVLLTEAQPGRQAPGPMTLAEIFNKPGTEERESTGPGPIGFQRGRYQTGTD